MAKIINVSPGYLQLMYKNRLASRVWRMLFIADTSVKEYLRHHLYTVAEIADRCGYRNVEHFCRQFKQMTGSSPKQFHKRREGVPADLTELGYKSHF